MRGAAFLIAALAAALGCSRAVAAAAPRVWPGSTIRYADLTGGSGYHDAVRRAVQAWNALHVGVRFVPAPGTASVLKLTYAPGRCLSGSAGSAPLGFRAAGARVVVRSCPRLLRPLLVAHELARVLGLPNDDRDCSLMNSRGVSDGVSFALPAKCSRWAPPSWLPGLVDPASVALARKLYSSPGSVVGATITSTAAAPRIAWRLPRGTAAARMVVVRGSGRCPNERDLAAGTATVVYDRPAYAGLHAAVDRHLPDVAGQYCYGVYTLSALGRATRTPGFVTYVFDAPPTAAFTVAASPVAGAPVAFSDTSTDSDGAVVHWRWDFGDPSSGAADTVDTGDAAAGRAVTHSYGAAGTYTVSLVVTDDAGKQAMTSEAVVVAAAGGGG